MKKCVIIQLEAVHEITIPQFIHTLNLLGWRPSIFINERCLVRSDIFDLLDGMEFDINYVPINVAEDWLTLKTKIKQIPNVDFVISNTCQHVGTISFLSKLQLPIIGLVHNANIFLDSPEAVEFSKQKNVYLVTLWDHITARLRSGFSHRSDSIATVRQTFILPEPRIRSRVFESGQKLRVAITGSVNRKIRNLDSLFDLVESTSVDKSTRCTYVVCGGGPDREELELAVAKKGLQDTVEFLPLDKETGFVPYSVFFETLKSVDFIATLLLTEQRSYLEYKITSGIITAVGMGVPLIMDSATASVYSLPSVVVDDDFNDVLQHLANKITSAEIADMQNKMEQIKSVYCDANKITMQRVIGKILVNEKLVLGKSEVNNIDTNEVTDMGYVVDKVKQAKDQYHLNMMMIDGYLHRCGDDEAKRAYSSAVESVFFMLAMRPNITKTLEIGAYEAGFSKKVKERRPDIECIAFEANPFVYEQFEESVKDANVDYRHNVVNSDGSSMNIRIPLDYRGTERELTNQMSSLMQNNSTENTKEVSVPGICLDRSLSYNADDTMVAWIDVEGACGAVLPGCKDVLKQCVAVYIEVERTEIWKDQWLDKDIAAFFDELGFYPVAKDFQRPNQYNVIYLNSRYDLNKPVVNTLWTEFDRITKK